MGNVDLMALLFGGLSIAALFTIFEDDDSDASEDSDATDLDDTDVVAEGTTTNGNGGNLLDHVAAPGDGADTAADSAAPDDGADTAADSAAPDDGADTAADSAAPDDGADATDSAAPDDGADTATDSAAPDDGADTAADSAASDDGADTATDSAAPDDGADKAADSAASDDGAGAGAEVYFSGFNSDYHGGDERDHVTLAGTASAWGGEGNDTLIANGTGDLWGEGGDDVIYGNSEPLSEEEKASSVLRDNANYRENHLYGGDGDDTIYFDSYDTVSGGEGSDIFEGFLHSLRNPATITDFDPAEDALTLWVDYPQYLSVEEVDGDTLIKWGDGVMGRIEGQTDMSVGYYTPEEVGDGNAPGAEISEVVDADGNTVSADDVDIIIAKYPTTSS